MGSTLQQSPRAQVGGVGCASAVTPSERLARPVSQSGKNVRKIRHVTFARSKFAFLTLPRYSMIALSNAVEPLRMANIITGQSVYEWSIVSLDGQPTPASNGLQLSPTHRARRRRRGRHPVRVRRRGRAGGGVAEDPGRAEAPGRAARAARSAVHRRLRARQGRAAGSLPRHHPLGESLGAARGVSAHPAERPALHHRPRPLHLLRRRRAAGSDAAPGGERSSARTSRS